MGVFFFCFVFYSSDSFCGRFFGFETRVFLVGIFLLIRFFLVCVFGVRWRWRWDRAKYESSC
jgi:hypothetical protein